MKLVVGLGNPGVEYVNTRHNVGFDLLDYLVDEKFTCEKFNALYKVVNIGQEKVILIKPLTYMNLSGDAVIKYVNYYKIKLNDILVIQDDLDMNLGKIKFVFNSSSGGHNGIKSIESKLNSKCYLRLKIGISNDKLFDTKDYVLGKFKQEDDLIIKNTYSKLRNLLIDFVNMDKSELMCKYNNK